MIQSGHAIDIYTTKSLRHGWYNTAATPLVDHGAAATRRRSDCNEEWRMPAQRAHGRSPVAVTGLLLFYRPT